MNLPRWRRMEIEKRTAEQAVAFWEAREAMLAARKKRDAASFADWPPGLRKAQAAYEEAVLVFETANAGLGQRVADYKEVQR